MSLNHRIIQSIVTGDMCFIMY